MFINKTKKAVFRAAFLAIKKELEFEGFHHFVKYGCIFIYA
ncbi:hypothetical protein HNQ88_000543 [Aureibacter tunicatorum]|uniref:Uncharacterized protein n=1 Tax=Aureibacter tunicatorum TaxID=866807 RepID=A0AAE4BRT4_9BACT|nr:hypothetical protein [Aureibacter tunicatorum]BDD02601.1 hypothetical protein AUTU_00840 [Aureibacter tunicatorum]